jgi:uncharacterized SAM-binding protein YcdF (DUF218 family)
MLAVFINLLTTLLLPPLCFLVPCVIGLFLLKRRPRTARFLIAVPLALMWILSVPPVGEWLLLQLDRTTDSAAANPERYRTAQAIVVLSHGRYYESLDYGGDTVDAESLERVRRAAALHRQTGLPVLVTGGRPENDEKSLAELLKLAADEYSMPLKWQETAARNTGENARFSRRILTKEKIDTIVLVTHGWHMLRAKRAFERAGFKVIPAATGLHHRPIPSIHNILPATEGLQKTTIFMHEIIGLAWYEITQAGRE